MKSNQNSISHSRFTQSANMLLGDIQINLLEKIEELGSLTRAAKAVGICYKTAWNTIKLINSSAEKPLVDRRLIGKGFGGSCLTQEGIKHVLQLKTTREEQRYFLDIHEARHGISGSYYYLVSKSNVITSACNTFTGIVSSICRSAMYGEVTLGLGGGLSLVAVVGNTVIDSLKLTTGSEVHARVKASSVIIATGLHKARVTAGNIFYGVVESVTSGPDSIKTDIKINAGMNISCAITHCTVARLGLKTGDHVCALFKASNVILGVN